MDKFTHSSDRYPLVAQVTDAMNRAVAGRVEDTWTISESKSGSYSIGKSTYKWSIRFPIDDRKIFFDFDGLPIYGDPLISAKERHLTKTMVDDINGEVSLSDLSRYTAVLSREVSEKPTYIVVTFRMEIKNGEQPPAE